MCIFVTSLTLPQRLLVQKLRGSFKFRAKLAGANLGGCTLLLASQAGMVQEFFNPSKALRNCALCSFHMGQGFSVVAVEPNPMTAKLLKAAVLRNGFEERVQVMQVAVGCNFPVAHYT